MIASLRTVIVVLMLMTASIAATAAAATSYLQCVPFARAASGVDLFGNARDWWAAAEGRYERGRDPRVGAVMHFAPTRAMPIGHVAVVSAIVSDRELLIDHANWSPINGRRGQIERGARVIDVSAAGDWSEVRVWYAPIRDLGLRSNPVSGFIYPDGVWGGGRNATAIAAVSPQSITPDADGTLGRIVESLGR
jgi:surface antigen